MRSRWEKQQGKELGVSDDKQKSMSKTECVKCVSVPFGSQRQMH